MEHKMLYQTVLDQFVSFTKAILQERLTGVYLHGSLAMGCFHPEQSDIDLIVVISEDISDSQKKLLMEEIVRLNREAPPKGLEISVVKKEYCCPFQYPTPFELHFSPMHLQWYFNNQADYIQKMKGTDKDLAAHFSIINKYGIVLYGEKIERVFSQVPLRDYVDSILGDIQNAPEDILEQPVYIALNLCRVLAFLSDNLYLSKEEGGKWGLAHLPQEYHAVILSALNCYRYNLEMNEPKESLAVFANQMLSSIKSKLKFL